MPPLIEYCHWPLPDVIPDRAIPRSAFASGSVELRKEPTSCPVLLVWSSVIGLSVADDDIRTGASFTPATVMVTAAEADVRLPSLAVNRNEPVPLKLAVGVKLYMPVAASIETLRQPPNSPPARSSASCCRRRLPGPSR